MKEHDAQLSPSDVEIAFAEIVGTDERAVAEAASRLSYQRAPSVTQRLIELLSDVTRPNVRQGILYALAWHNGPTAREVALKIAADVGEADGVRHQATEVIEYGFASLDPGDGVFERAVAVLTSMLDEPSPEIRYASVYALGSAADLCVRPLLERMLADHSPVPGWGETVAQRAKEQLEWLDGAARHRREGRPPYDR